MGLAPDPQIHDAFKTGLRDVQTRDLGVLWFRLRRDQASIRRQRSGKPDGAVAAQCSYPEDGACSLSLRQKCQELSLAEGDANGRPAAALDTKAASRAASGDKSRSSKYWSTAVHCDSFINREYQDGSS